MRTLRFAAALATLALLPAGQAAAEETHTHHVRRAEVVVTLPMTVGGSFEARTTALSGRCTPAMGDKSQVGGAFEVDLKTLDTGIELRNGHLTEKYLEVGKGDGFDKARLSDIRCEGVDLSTFRGKTAFRGNFSLHGTTREVSGEAEIRADGDGVQVLASFPLKISDYGIAKPSHLGVGVKNEIKVKVDLSLGTVAGGTK